MFRIIYYFQILAVGLCYFLLMTFSLAQGQFQRCVSHKMPYPTINIDVGDTNLNSQTPQVVARFTCFRRDSVSLATHVYGKPGTLSNYAQKIADTVGVLKSNVTIKYDVRVRVIAGGSFANMKKTVDLANGSGGNLLIATVLGPDPVGHPGSREFTYEVTIENIIAEYKDPATGRNIVLPPSEIVSAVMIDGWNIGSNTDVAFFIANYKEPVGICDARGFEVMVEPAAGIKFGDIGKRFIQSGGKAKQPFSIAVKRKYGIGHCQTETISPKVTFSHAGLESSDGGLYLPEAGLVFKIYDNNKQVRFGQEDLLGDLNYDNQNGITKTYFAEVGQASGTTVKEGPFSGVILYTVTYR